jgi:lipoyl synthase
MTQPAAKSIPLAVVADGPAARPPLQEGVKQVAGDKIARSPVQFADAPVLRKPSWIRVRIPSDNSVARLKARLRENRLVTVCEEASCPNIHECFGHGTATFMILGEVCTRRCSFCDVAHGRPRPPDPAEPLNLARTIADMGLKYVVVTSVDRDDLRDGGAQHFVDCIGAIRSHSPGTRIEILTPDFRGKGRMERALEILATCPPDVFNHNLETVPDLYRNVRPGADYSWSLTLLRKFKAQHPACRPSPGSCSAWARPWTRCGRPCATCARTMSRWSPSASTCSPAPHHHPVLRYWTPDEFKALEVFGLELGFSHVASGPLVRSSYHADQQAADAARTAAGAAWPAAAPRAGTVSR